MNNKEKTDKILLITECIFMLFLIGLIIAKVAHIPGQDYKFHYGRIQDIAYEIKNYGIKAFPMRIYSNCLNGYGYGNPLFYGDTMLYLPGFIVACGASVITGYKIVMISALLLCFLCMFFCGYKMTASKNAALFAAGTYVFSTYFATDLFVRNAIGEAWAMVFLPIAFYGLYAIIYDKGKDWIYLPIGMVFIIWSHIITTFVFSICAFILICINYKKIDKTLIFRLIASVIITVLITANFVFPMIEQLATDKFFINGNIGATADIKVSSISYITWFIPSELLQYIVMFVNKIFHSDLPIYFSWSPSMIIYSVLLCYVFRLMYRNKLKAIKKDSYLVLIFIFVFIALPFFPIGVLSPIIGFIQLSWRFFVMLTFFVSIYLMYVYTNIDIKKPARIIMIAFCLLFTINISGLYITEILNSVIAHDETYDAVDVYKIGGCEYLPVECNNGLIQSISKWERIPRSNNNVLLSMNTDKKKTIITVQNNTYSDTEIEVPLIMYKGYSATDNNSNEFEIHRNHDGLLSVDINDYNGDVFVEYTGTMIQHISFYISFLSIVGFIIVFLIKLQKKYKK